jgi:hypothetical protein
LPVAVLRPALVNGAAGVVAVNRAAVCGDGVTVSHYRVIEIDSVVDPERVERVRPG